MKAAIYARCSTKDRQDVETQLMPIRDYLKMRGWDEFEVFTDIGVSGSKDTRPELDLLMKAARAGRFNVVVVARFDRFARSVKHLIAALEEFQSLKINFVSVNEQIDTSTAMGKMVFTVIAAVGELERSIILERIRAGIDRARRQGKILGRREIILDKERVRAFYVETQSLRKTALKFRVSKDKIAGIIKQEGVAC